METEIATHDLFEIDCTRELGPDKYFQSAPTQVVESSLGAYREAAATKEARFGYRFGIRTVGCPHELIVRYPDDKPRFMCIMDGSTYDLSTGIFSGDPVSVSGGMQEIHLVFWPRWAECTLVFMTWLEAEPAAVASFKVRELASLPPITALERTDGFAKREFGMAFEDPCGMGLGMGAASSEQWIKRIAAYMRHTGQSLLIYPIAWYHGPQFPAKQEPADAFEVAIAPDRRMYGRYTTQPPEWVTPLLDKFHQENLGFMAEVRFFRLGSLMQKMNINLEAIQAGVDTINNMLWNDQVQSGTMDWTVVYNARNYPEMLKRGLSVFVEKDFPYAYGERGYPDVGGGYPSSIVPPGAIFNPLHPIVQEAILNFVREIGQRYGRHPAFHGIAVGLWSETCLWYGSLKRGYDDVSVSLFQQDMGITVPVAADVPNRFSKRYAYLTTHCREEWIAWRCRRIRDLLLAVRNTLREARADLRLVLVPAPGNVAWAGQETGHPEVELLREAGFDPTLLAGEPGVEIDMTTEGGAGMHKKSTTSVPPAPVTPATVPLTGICIADSWVESWGKNRMFPCDPDDPNIEALGRIGGQDVSLYRFTCEYPPDGFWYQDQWRISTPFPAGEHYLAPLACAVADIDALRLTRGGLYPDTAHAKEQRRFARVFCALPRHKFETVGATTDPVAVRTLVYEGRRYLYAVNRGPSPVRATVYFSQPPCELMELPAGTKLDTLSAWEINLGPYELRAFSLLEAAIPTNFNAVASVLA